MPPYITLAQLKPSLFQSPDADDQELTNLCERVSRVFDLACQRDANFFAAAGPTATSKTILGTGERVLKTGLFVPDSVSAVEMPDGEATPDYYAGNGYDSLWIRKAPVFGPNGTYWDSPMWPDEKEIVVTAKWGFVTVPSDVVQACIEIATKTWRAKDAAFARVVGLDDNRIIQDDLPPLAKLIVLKWSARRAPVFA